MKKLKVLQINKLYYPVTGGVERVVQQIAEGLQDKTDMKVLVCQPKGKTVYEKINGVVVCRQKSIGMIGNLPIPFGFFYRFRKMAKGRDIIHIHMPFPFADIAYLLSGYKGKIVLWWHSDVVRQKKMMVFYRPFMELLLKRADKIIVATKGHIEGSFYLKPYYKKCCIIPFGVDRVIEEDADKYFTIRKRKELSKEIYKKQDINFLFIGRLVYYKGCKILLEAFRNVENATLTIVGSGPLETELKNYVKQYHMEKKVIFTGYVEDEKLPFYFKQCDVFVLASIARSEAFGLVQIEAMSYGKPVINTNLPSGVPYVSLHGKTGLTVEPESAAAMEKAIFWMIEHPKERQEMGENARIRVKEEFCLDHMLNKVYELYKTLTEEEYKK